MDKHGSPTLNKNQLGTPLCELSSPACRPALQVRVRGTVRLPSGDVNLVATQLALDREHANLITFHPDQLPGLDPVVDLVMLGGDLRVAIQVGALGGMWLTEAESLVGECECGSEGGLHFVLFRGPICQYPTEFPSVVS